MEKIFVTLTGTQYYHGKEFFEAGMKVKLIKDPDNEYDKEAIIVELPGLGLLGHIANSPKTVIGESISAGRLYDKIGQEAFAKVKYVLPTGVLLKVCKKSLL
ncbi:MAG: HIRAN domain-containing protein [Eubacteriales bacterium]|nr:HIRAN domain-containing protein [Eubacteriales bacterium]